MMIGLAKNRDLDDKTSRLADGRPGENANDDIDRWLTKGVRE
jgi:hypothetical protein